jgi:cobalt-zinc-cadmium efflux system protein
VESQHQHHDSGQNLKIAFFLNLGFTIFELIGGYYVNSVAIISDAIHDLGDSLSLGTAWYLDKKAKAKADKKFSFGYARFSLLGALLNSVVLIVGSIYVVYEAVGRFIEPEQANASGMIAFALVGVVVNGYAAHKMSGGKTLNEKVISWHLLEDVLGWVAVLIVGIVLYFKDIAYLDPALSLLIAAYILWGVFRRLKETLFIFLQGVPKEIDLTQIERQLLGITEVRSVSNTHVWSLEGEHHVFSTHLLLKPSSLEQVLEIKKVAKEVLKPYGFLHCTIDIDVANE